jgi:hypothetical protein
MKKLLILSVLIIFSSCKQNEEKKESEQELTIAQKIANAHGFEHWNNVKTIEFTFGGKIEEPNSGRAWVWNPKTSDIKLNSDGKTVEYNRNNMDSTSLKADRAFINDKFWTFIPFQLIWDDGITISEPIKSVAPISNENLNKITLLYSDVGGYTPGDAYDLYFDKDYIIKEWQFRRDNSEEASISNTFESYKDLNGIKIAQEHKKAEGDWNILIRNLKIELEE